MIQQALILTDSSFLYLCFQIVFILELSFQIIAFGILPYFSDYWHWLDAVVVATSALDIIVAILAALSGLIGGTGVPPVNTKGKGEKEKEKEEFFFIVLPRFISLYVILYHFS